MLTQRAKYGLKALIILASPELSGDRRPIGEIAQRGHMPQKFLEAILLDLRRHGFVTSRRGKAGGYSLVRPAAEIMVGDVIRALDGPLAPIPCASLTAYRPCLDCETPVTCEVRILMRRVRDAMSGVLDATSIAELAVMGGAESVAERMTEMR